MQSRLTVSGSVWTSGGGGGGGGAGQMGCGGYGMNPSGGPGAKCPGWGGGGGGRGGCILTHGLGGLMFSWNNIFKNTVHTMLNRNISYYIS